MRTPRTFEVLKRVKIGNKKYFPGETVMETFDRPFDRLVTFGALRLAPTGKAQVPVVEPEPQVEDAIVEDVVVEDEIVDEPVDLAGMTKKELVAYAEGLGIELPSKITKAEIVEQIEAL